MITARQCTALLLLAGAPSALGAQASAPPPSNVLVVYREVVKVGKGAAHNALETAWSWAQIQAKAPYPFVAATSLTGSNEIWYIAPFPNWAEWEKSNDLTASNATLAAIDKRFRSQEDQFLTEARSMTLRPRPELNYGTPADLPNMRYISATRVSVRPGHTAEYEESRKMVKAAHETAHLTDGFSVWEVTGGAPAGTFYTFVARKSLAELDSGATIHGAAYTAALGGDSGQKKLAALTASAVIGSETDQFEFTPSQSVAPPDWVTANPKMWKRSAPVTPKKP